MGSAQAVQVSRSAEDAATLGPEMRNAIARLEFPFPLEQQFRADYFARNVSRVRSATAVYLALVLAMTAVNMLGAGPQGLGGDATAFAVHVELAATHIKMNPVAVNMQCHSARRASAVLTEAGVEYGY